MPPEPVQALPEPSGSAPPPASSPPSPGDWRAALPEDLRAEKSLEAIKGAGWDEAGPLLAKGYVNAQRLVGGAVKVPGEGAKPEEVAEFHRKLGVPAEATAEKYGLKLPEIPKELGDWQPAEVDSALKAMHAAGATPKVAQAAFDAYAQYVLRLHDRARAQRGQQEAEQRVTVLKSLEKQWGPQDGPVWKRNQALADGAIRHVLDQAPATVVQAIVEQANASAELAAAWATVGDALLEDGFLAGDEVPGGMTAQEAQAKADAMRNDPKHPLNIEGHPQRQAALDAFLELNRVAAGPRGREVVAIVGR